MAARLPALIVKRLGAERDVVSVVAEWEVSEAALGDLEVATRAFAAVGQRGGFAAPGIPPSDSSLSLRGDLRMTGVGLDGSFEYGRIDLRAFNVLRCVLAGTAGEAGTVSHLVIEGSAELRSPAANIPEPNAESDEEAYPDASNRLDFGFSIDGSCYSKMRRCLVEFARPLEPKEAGALVDWTKPWYEILEAGAFAIPIALPWSARSIRGGVTQFDEVTAEILVDRYEACEAAWNVLVNMLASFAHGGPRIISVQVE